MRSTLLIIMFIFHYSVTLHAQEDSSTAQGVWKRLSDTYEAYRYEGITHRRFKHEDVQERLHALSDHYRIATVGQSNEGRALQLVSIGGGPVDVFLWSQMHGNEPTATMALMDVMSWLEQNEDGFDEERKHLLSSLTIHMLPMLNPDGAERFRRRNTQDIDINRDALRLQTPEGRTLKRVRDSLDADWGFNLHDQGRTTSVGQKPATLSFLAPAYNYERSINSKREDAMQLIAHLNAQLQQMIPGQIGRYWDDFEPRAFGDNIQKWGTRTILIESGGQYGDREKQQIRKLNYLALLQSIYSIATKEFESFTTDQYESIPNNTRGLRDVIIKNLQLPAAMGGYLTDIAFNYEEVQDAEYSKHYLSASIVDAGDLSTSGAYLAHDMKGYSVSFARSHHTSFETMDELLNQQFDLLRNGVAHVDVEHPDYFHQELLLQVNKAPSGSIGLGENPSLVFSKEGTIHFVLVNGYLMNIRKEPEDLLEGKLTR